LSSYRKRCSSTAKVRISGAISRFLLQVFANPFVFLPFPQELPLVALQQQEKLKRLSQKAFHCNQG
jgi:hypothetical protein